MDVPENVNLEAYRQAFETYRHYANLRFAALTAFIAITGGLFVVALRKPTAEKTEPVATKTITSADNIRLLFLCIVGVFIAGIFLFYDTRVDELMTFFVYNAYHLAKELGMNTFAQTMPPQTRASRLSSLEPTVTVYWGAIVAWIVAALLRMLKKL